MENIVRKGEIACNKQFQIFSQCFLFYYGTYFSFKMHFKMSDAICFNLDQSKILSPGNVLKLDIYYMTCIRFKCGEQIRQMLAYIFTDHV